MHIRIAVMSLVFMAFVLGGCSNGAQSQNFPLQRLGYNTGGEPIGYGNIRLIHSDTIIKRGDSGSITIQGDSGAVYRITALYMRGDTPMTTNVSKRAGPDGMLTWSWTVADDTKPGTYAIAISGQGRVLDTTYTVLE